MTLWYGQFSLPCGIMTPDGMDIYCISIKATSNDVGNFSEKKKIAYEMLAELSWRANFRRKWFNLQDIIVNDFI